MPLSHAVATASVKGTPNASYPARLIEEELEFLTQNIDSLWLSEANKELAWRIILGEERSGVNTLIPQEDQNTLLHLAVMRGKLTLMKILLAQRADITLMNRANESPLLLAFKFDVRNPNNKEICIEMLKHLKMLRINGNADSNCVIKFFQDIQTILNGCIDFNLAPGLRREYWADSTFWNFFAKHSSFETRTGLTTLDWDYFKYICQIYAQYYQTMLVSVRTFDPMALQSYILENYEAHTKIWGMYFINKIYRLAHVLPQDVRIQAEHAKRGRLLELQAENQRLIQEQAALTTQISHFTQTSQEVSAVRAESSVVIADKDRLIARLEDENRKLTLENTQLKDRLDGLVKRQEMQEGQLQVQATKLQTQEGQLQVQEGQLKVQATKLQTQEGQLKAHEVELQTQSAAHKAETTELRTEVATHEAETTKLRIELQTQATMVQDQIAELEKQQEEKMLSFQRAVASLVPGLLDVTSKLTHLAPPGTTGTTCVGESSRGNASCAAAAAVATRETDELPKINVDLAPAVSPCQAPYVVAGTRVATVVATSTTSGASDETLLADKKDDTAPKVDATLTSH